VGRRRWAKRRRRIERRRLWWKRERWGNMLVHQRLNLVMMVEKTED
jgi:hypothetical protein